MLDAADSSLSAAEKAADTAEKAKTKTGLIVSILALSTIIGILYLINRDTSS